MDYLNKLTDYLNILSRFVETTYHALFRYIETTYHQARTMSVSKFVVSHKAAIRLGFFFGILLVMALWELAAPRRRLTVSKMLRWASNLGIVFLDSFLVPPLAWQHLLMSTDGGFLIISRYHIVSLSRYQ